MKNLLQKYFGFTKREYNGLLALMIFLTLITLFPYVYSAFSTRVNPASSEVMLAIQKLELVNRETNNSYRTTAYHSDEDKPTLKKSLFHFDPNTVDVNQWQQLGLSFKQAQAIINYRNKGGKFYKVEDLKKMYTISPERFLELAPFVSIVEQKLDSKFPPKSFIKKQSYAKKALVVVDINTADTLQMQEIKGIGAAFARRIFKYRERLGGFYKKEQLLEVFGLDSTKFEEIKSQINIDAQNIKRININTAEFEDLRNNPYLNYKQINAMLQYRKQHGKFNSIDDLRKVVILSPENIQAISPYLSF